jgi:hypothetical protein
MQVARAAFSEMRFTSNTGRPPVMRKGGFWVTNRTVQGYPPVLSHTRSLSHLYAFHPGGRPGGAAAGNTRPLCRNTRRPGAPGE